MALEVQRFAPQSPPPPGSFPVTVGWTQAAMAVQAVLSLKTPVHLRMTIEAHEPLLIDFRYHAFRWATPLEEFPVNAVHTGLQTIPTGPNDPPFFDLPGQHLDGLLWAMGLNSFDGKPAFWLTEGDRYRLTRWPNLNQHAHNLTQLRMIAVLGNAYASVAELAGFTGAEEAEAQRLINALSLMRILAASAAEPPAPIAPPSAEATRDSLFTRLRKRLGR